MVRRREVLKSALGLAATQLPLGALAQSPASAAAPALTGNGPPKAFDYAWLKGQARFLAGSPYQASKDVLPPGMKNLGYDQYNNLRFKTDRSLWNEPGSMFRLQFFHVGRG